jgi:hypothetical protein
MVISRITTFAFERVEARAIDAQAQRPSGSNAFNIVGLADRAPGAKAQVARVAEPMSLRARASDRGPGLSPASSRSRPTSPPLHRRPRDASAHARQWVM